MVLLSLSFALSCAHHPESPEVPEVPEVVSTDHLRVGLKEILEVRGPQLDPSTRQAWPPTKWTHGRAYTYNFTRTGPGHQLRIFDEKGWSDGIVQTLELSHEQAAAALELTHRTQGDVRASKCAFPRHAVVLFDQEDQPVASMNICFECTDILVWPPYFEDKTLGDSRYALHTTMVEGEDAIEMPLLLAVHEGVLTSWERFFDLAGAEQFVQ